MSSNVRLCESIWSDSAERGRGRGFAGLGGFETGSGEIGVGGGVLWLGNLGGGRLTEGCREGVLGALGALGGSFGD